MPSYAYAQSGGESDWRAAAALADLRDVLPTVVTHRVPLADVATAFEIAADKSTGAIKVAITPITARRAARVPEAAWPASRTRVDPGQIGRLPVAAFVVPLLV